MMHLSPPRRALAVVVLTLAALGGGCGGDDDDATSAASDTPTTTLPRPGHDVAEVQEFCGVVRDSLAQFNAETLQEAMSPDLEVRRGFYVRQKELYARLSQVAPSAIRGDVEVQVRTQQAVADAQISGDQATMSAAVGELASPDFQAAAERVTAYAQDACGIQITTTIAPAPTAGSG